MTISTNELRIGNWYNEFGIPKIATPQLILRLYQIELAGKTAIDVSPIPLTTEVLEKCGFRNCEEESFLYLSFSDGTHNIYIHTDGGVVFEPFMVNDKHFSIRIFYLHQLQNLYFALTGEELEYKP